MSRMDELAKKLEVQKGQNGKNRAELEREKQAWLTEIEKLYENVHQWLAPLRGKKLVDLRYDEIEIAEDFLGRYTVKRLTIQGADWKLVLTPVGRFIVGSRGRIDAQCGSQVRLLVLQDDGWKQAIKDGARFNYLSFDNQDDFAQMLDEMIE